jgi:hypothetical protein
MCHREPCVGAKHSKVETESQEVNCYWVREHEGEKANHTLQEIC